MREKSSGPGVLTKFKDCLRLPSILRPRMTGDQQYTLRIRMRPALIQLHSELPPTEVWTYESSLPGPTVEVSRGQHVDIEWMNDIPKPEVSRHRHHRARRFTKRAWTQWETSESDRCCSTAIPCPSCPISGTETRPLQYRGL